MSADRVQRSITRGFLFYYSWFVPYSVDWLVADEEKYKLERRTNKMRRFIEILYFYSNLKLFINAFFQYKQDFNLLRLARLFFNEGTFNYNQLHSNITSTNRSLLTLEELELLQQMEDSRMTLELIGSPHKDCIMTAEPFYVAVIFLTYIMYWFGGRFLRSTGHQQHFCSMLMDGKDELARMRRLIETEVKQLVVSSDNSIVSVLDKVLECETVMKKIHLNSKKSISRLPVIRETTIATNERSIQKGVQRCNLQLIGDDHRLLMRQIKQLLQTDALIPINKAPDWIKQNSLAFSTYSVSSTFFSLAQDTFATFFLPLFMGSELSLNSWTDYWLMVDLWILIIISFSSTNFFVAYLSVNAADQTRYLLQLGTNLKDSLAKNQAKLEQVLIEPGGGVETSKLDKQALLEEVNFNALKMILDYKVFLAQLAPIRKFFSAVVVSNIVIVIVAPILVRAHVTYHSSINLSGAAIAASLAMVFMSDTVLMPLCAIHNQGQKLYGLLSQLLAHMIEVNEQNPCGYDANGKRYIRHIYNEHNVNLLRRILADPDEFIDQFAAKIMPGVHLNFGTLLETHYWYSMILISDYFHLESWKRLLGSRLTDPFSLF